MSRFHNAVAMAKVMAGEREAGGPGGGGVRGCGVGPVVGYWLQWCLSCLLLGCHCAAAED